MDIKKLTNKQLLNLQACTRCGECTDSCTAYSAREDLDISPAKKIELLKKRVRNNSLLGKLFLSYDLDEEKLQALAKGAYDCTLCSKCETTCPVNIDLQKMWISLRELLAEEGRAPEELESLKERLKKSRNLSFDSNEGRADWINQLVELPADRYVRDKAEVIYFVGCVSSFSPRVFKIPRSIVQIFRSAEVDFGLLGDEEWCCGYPLLTSGFKKDFYEFAKHNIEKVNSTGAKYLVTSCPSCYHMWTHIYKEALEDIKMDFEVMHVVQYLNTIIGEKKLDLKPLEAKVTYHDPCDLGRNSGIYEEPRNIIRAIPGVDFIELEKNRDKATCCGGGGNLEASDVELAAGIAAIRAEEIIKTGADIIATACQQCVRTIALALKKKKSKIKVMDITELVLKSLKG